MLYKNLFKTIVTISDFDKRKKRYNQQRIHKKSKNSILCSMTVLPVLDHDCKIHHLQIMDSIFRDSPSNKNRVSTE